ncbi:MAG: hypothetical protein A2017_10880 [Lentisphaerae bacterium GWF2_44_16]|nr:MAG: hypothetical protein A2017_10880 [Lentisphaerae bacterium GWF2_44_16]
MIIIKKLIERNAKMESFDKRLLKFSFIFSAFLIWEASCFTADKTPDAVEIDGKVLLADFSKPEKWELRNKTELKPEIGFKEKDPQGETALTFKSSQDGKAVISQALFSGNEEWRKKGGPRGISFWIKNNGEPQAISFRMSSISGKSINIPVRLPDKKTWQYCYIPIEEYEGKDFSVQNIRHFYNTNLQTCKFYSGPGKT